MSAAALALWLANVLLDTGGQLAFKAAADDHGDHDGLARWLHMASRPWIWVGVACYACIYPTWIAFLSLVPLSQAVLLGAINIVALMLAGRFLFGEKLTRLRVTGVSIIALGVAIVGAAP